MAPPKANEKTIQYRRTHNLLLGTRLLSQRGSPSPFTLILDSLSQSSIPLVEEYISRAKARGKLLDALAKEIAATATPEKSTENTKAAQNLVVFDSANHLVSLASEGNSKSSVSLAYFLSSLLTPSVTILATYHTDIPRIHPVSASNAYTPDPLDLLKYLCTTLITVYSPSHIFAQKRAIDKSLPAPLFGLDEGIEGSLTSLGTNTGWCDTCGPKDGSRAIIYELEHRRMSGRAMTDWFFLLCHPSKKTRERLILLEDHPAYNPAIEILTKKSEGGEDDDLTFSLGLTAKQKYDRDNVVLPYFDAQNEEGGTGGRILYVPGREDDWDEEEDEI
ncbi:hypothetical protein ABW19_dt0201887 [Dactylella cylindrospora]|nr:hypothetical protein ABW19_dt0201887 [Dactylella cylindrospora]